MHVRIFFLFFFVLGDKGYEFDPISKVRQFEWILNHERVPGMVGPMYDNFGPEYAKHELNSIRTLVFSSKEQSYSFGIFDFDLSKN